MKVKHPHIKSAISTFDSADVLLDNEANTSTFCDDLPLDVHTADITCEITGIVPDQAFHVTSVDTLTSPGLLRSHDIPS